MRFNPLVWLYEFIFPSCCCICGNPTDAELICSDCLNDIRFIYPPVCKKCGRPVNDTDEICDTCKENPLDIIAIRSVAMHTGVVRRLIHELKYNNKRKLAQICAEFMSRILEEDARLKACDSIVPVPLSRTRLRERGYNQAELIANHIAKITEKNLLNVLKRIKHTQAQANLSRKERIENVREAFVADNKVNGLRIIVIDDVFTTGSTLNECAKALYKKGAKEVYGLTFASAI